MTKYYASADTEIVIPFHDIDGMQIAWHGHYVKYLEIARTELLVSIDYDVDQMKASGYAWPVIELKIRYAHPLRYRQRIVVAAGIVEFENRLKIGYRIFDKESGSRLTRAHTVQVATDLSSGEMMYASPPILKAKLGL
jgi:acyl-CoA thioester hydrolase